MIMRKKVSRNPAARMFTSLIRKDNDLVASVKKGLADLKAGRSVSLHDLKVKLGDAPPLECQEG